MNTCKWIKPFSLIALFLFIPLAFAGCNTKTVASKTNSKHVKGIQVSKSTVTVTVAYAGKLKPQDEILVSSKIPGRVENVNFEVGMPVTKGDLLFSLENKEAQAQLDQSKDALANAQANYVKTSDSMLNQQQLQTQQAVDIAQVGYDETKRQYDLIHDQYLTLAVSKQEMDAADTKLKNAFIQLDSAKKNLTLFNNKTSPQAINVAKTQVDQLQGAVDLAALQYQNTVITSPISGVISMRGIDKGEIIAAGTPAYSVMSSDMLLLEIMLPDQIKMKVKKGQTLQLKTNALADKLFDGIVDNIAPNADAKNQLYTVKILVDNTAHQLEAGMIAKAVVVTDKKENTLSVPPGALISDNENQYVYIVSADQVKKVKVKIGISNDTQIEILDQLIEGDFVITEGQSFLSEGEKVIKTIL